MCATARQARERGIAIDALPGRCWTHAHRPAAMLLGYGALPEPSSRRVAPAATIGARCFIGSLLRGRYDPPQYAGANASDLAAASPRIGTAGAERMRRRTLRVAVLTVGTVLAAQALGLAPSAQADTCVVKVTTITGQHRTFRVHVPAGT